MSRKVAFFAVLLMVFVSFTVYAIEKRDKNFLNKVKVDPTTLKEKKSAVAPQQQPTPIPPAEIVPITPPLPTGAAECYLIQDPGEVAHYFGSFAQGDVIAKYFDPALYCEEPVYPLLIHDVDFVLYDFAEVGSVDIIVDVHIVCHDSCDGPGTRIYGSDPVTVTTFYPDMAHIDLPDMVCVWEPFFISLEYATGIQGETPSFLWSDETYPCDSCHAWVYRASGGDPFWTEWHDFWPPPAGGCPIIRVTAATSDPDCEQAPCEDPLDTLWGGTFAYRYWRNPGRYGDQYLNERFDLPLDHGGRLDEIEIAFYQEAEGCGGNPDPDIYVWLSDGLYPIDNNPPYQAIAEFNLTYGDIVWYPAYTVVQTWDRGIIFDPGESFHIGYGHAYIDGDTLCMLSDDGSSNSNRSVEWWGQWGTILDYWGVGVDFLINAVICPYEPPEPPESTFTISCSPFLNYASPGDPPAVLYTVDVGSVLGYDLHVELDIDPATVPAGITYYYDPAIGIPEFTSDLYLSCDPGVAYGNYTLTLRGTGADAQVRTCDVMLTVQPPYDEALVDFYHGNQTASNFGAVGNDSTDNFVWYGTNYLYDGSFIVATTDPDHMALDVYNCEHWGWIPTEHMKIYYDSAHNANIAYGDFFTPEFGIHSCEYDSAFIVGIMDSCVEFSIKTKIYYNPAEEPIYGMYISLFEDWNVGDADNNWGDMDTLHNLMWMYDPVDPNLVFGMMKAPFYDDPLYNMAFIRNGQYVYPNWGFCDSVGGFWGLDSLYWLITRPGYFYPEAPATDFSLLMTAQPIDLLPGEDGHIEIWIDFGRDLQDGLTWSQWWHRVLRYAGFYRGDVNASDTLELPAMDVSDLFYLVYYLCKSGPEPEPFIDQGDVNADRIVNIGDIAYLINYVFKGGPAPIDYVRFIPSMWSRPSLFENPLWR